MTTDALTRLKAAVVKYRAKQPAWPPVAEWPVLLVGVVNTEAAANKLGEVIRSAGVWSATREVPVDLHHEGSLKIGVTRECWCAGGALWCEIVAPPSGTDVLVDEARRAVGERLAVGQPVPLSMETTEHLRAGPEVLRARLLSVAILVGAAEGGIVGAQAYGDGRRGLSSAAARLVAEAEWRGATERATRWRGAHEAYGWRA